MTGRCEDAPCCGCCTFSAMYAESDPYDEIDRFYDDYIDEEVD